MPAPETSHRYQHAVLWPWAGYEAGEGKPTVSTTYVELRVRWEPKKSFIIDDKGNRVSIDGWVHVDREIAQGSILWLGKYSNYVGTGSADEDTEHMEVVMYKEVPDLKGRFTHRSVAVRRYGDQLPTRV